MRFFQEEHLPYARVLRRLPVFGRPLNQHVLSLALYSCFALLLFFPVLSRPATTYIGGEPGPAATDPLSFMWFLTWTPYAVSHSRNPLLTDWIFSGSGANLAWNTAVPLIGFVMGPITWLAGPVFSYNVALISSVIASAWTAYYVTFRLFRCGLLPELLAGAVYGFSPFTMAHAVGHLHMTAAFTPPLFLLVLHDVIVAQEQAPWINGAKLAVLALIQYFLSAEVLLMEGVVASVGGTILLAACRRAVTAKRVRYVVQSLTCAILIVLPLLAYPLYLMLFGPWQPARPIHGADFAVADLLSFVLPTSAQAFLGSQSVSSAFTGGEWNTYLGVPLIALLVVIAHVRRGDGTTRFLLALMFAVAVLSLGPSPEIAGSRFTGIPLPWRLFEFVPLFRNVLTNRFGEYLYLPAGLILALYTADKSVSHSRRFLRVAATLTAVAFLIPRVPLYPATHAEIPNFFRLPRDTQRIESPALIVPFATDATVDKATAMLWQAEARMTFKMPEGYAFGQGTSPWPAPTSLSSALVDIDKLGSAPTVTSIYRTQVIAVLKAQRIKTIVLGPSLHEGEALSFLTEVLGWTPDLVDGVFVWWHVDRRI